MLEQIKTFKEWEEQKKHLQKLEDFVLYYRVHGHEMSNDHAQCAFVQRELDATLQHISQTVTTFLRKMPPCLIFAQRVQIDSGGQYIVPGMSSMSRNVVDSYLIAAELARYWGDVQLRDQGVSMDRYVYFTALGPLYLPVLEEEAFFEHVLPEHRVFVYYPSTRQAIWTVYE